MKHSFIMGIVMLYVILLGLQMFATGSSSTSATGVGSELHTYTYPSEITSHTDPSLGQSSVNINAGTMAKELWHLGSMALLYFPVLFTGNYVWFWWVFCFPIALSFWGIVALAIFGRL